MLKEIRRVGTFETNSSSTHSLCMCTEDEWNKFVNGDMLMYNDSEIISREKAQEMYEQRDKSYLDDYDFKQFCSYYCIKNYEEWRDNDYLEGYRDEYVLQKDMKAGEKIIAFGEYGYDG